MTFQKSVAEKIEILLVFFAGFLQEIKILFISIKLLLLLSQICI